MWLATSLPKGEGFFFVGLSDFFSTFIEIKSFRRINKQKDLMKKLLLVTGAAFFALAGHAQFNQSYLGVGYSKGEKAFDASQPQQQQQSMVKLMNDTLHYFFNKHYYMNDTTGSANLSFYTYSHPNPFLGDTLSHQGS